MMRESCGWLTPICCEAADRFGNADAAYHFDGVDDFIEADACSRCDGVDQGLKVGKL